tara:strand:+ start:910 stop:1344 length:435 start_codon:yes stop_codon:yes gene_type:complete
MSKNKITAAKANMMQMAKNGGLTGFMKGGGAYDGLMKAQPGFELRPLDGPEQGEVIIDPGPQQARGIPSQYQTGVTPVGPTTYVQNKTRRDGTNKNKEISAKKFNRVSNRYANQKGSNSLGTSTSRGQQVISGRNSGNSVSRRS